jgi:hypothetical protein
MLKKEEEGAGQVWASSTFPPPHQDAYTHLADSAVQQHFLFRLGRPNITLYSTIHSEFE